MSTHDFGSPPIPAGTQTTSIELVAKSSISQEKSLSTSGAIPPRLENLPREIGVLLASVGVLGIVLPGIAGAPALVAGGLVLWPKTFGKVENWLEKRFPKTHRQSMQQVGRFLDDLGRRYPKS